MISTDYSGASEEARSGPSAADERDHAADRRDRAAEQRDRAAEQRDNTADRRDLAADQRELHGRRRDQLAEQRDDAADQRDRAAQKFEESVDSGITDDAIDRSARARGEAASDRRGGRQDRRSGASDRVHAARDRNTALSDRGASAKERESASVDSLTGVYLRGPGFVELEREMARARRTRQPLALAFVDVDRLKVVNDTLGHAAGDRMLIEVANALKAKQRSYDLIMRYGGDEFVCTISGLPLADVMKRFALVNVALAQAPGHGSVAVGLAELQPGDSPLDLIGRADAALYRERHQLQGRPLRSVAVERLARRRR